MCGITSDQKKGCTEIDSCLLKLLNSEHVKGISTI